jgi:DNA polymerase elongation subunit (family B)
MKRCVIDIETEDLSPIEGRIICIGIRDVDNGSTIVFYDKDEVRMLKDFFDYFGNKCFKEIIGYNVLFDIRFIFARALKHNLDAHGFFTSSYHDLMGIMKSVKNSWSWNRPHTLEEWSQLIFGNGKVELGTSVADLYRKGMIDKIIEYNKQDVEITYNLWKRVEKILWS